VRRDKTLMSAAHSSLVTKTDSSAGVDIQTDVPDHLAHRRGEDAAGLVAMTPWLKLYPAGILYL
jgi:hypothetical protein